MQTNSTQHNLRPNILGWARVWPVLGIAALASISTAADVLAIEDAIKIAEKNAFGVQIADAAILKSRQRLNEVNAQQGFRVSTSATYLRYGFEQVANIGGQSVVFQPLDQTTLSGQIGYVFDLSGNVRRQANAAKKAISASQFQKSSTLNDLRLAVRRGYYQVMRAQSLLKVSEANFTNISAQVVNAEKQVRAGVTAKIDLQRLQAQQASAEADVLSAKNGVKLAKQALNLSLARPIETEFDVAEVSGDVSIRGEYDRLIEAAEVVRPEVRSLQANIESLKFTRRATMQSLEPSLNFNLNYQRVLDPAGLNPQRELTTNTLVLSIPLYDAGSTRSRVKQFDQDIITAQVNLKQQRLAIAQEIRNASANYSTALARQESARKQVALAREVARLARIRRDAGESTVIEVLDAEAALTSAENGLVNATFDMLTAYAELQRAVGNDDFEAAVKEAAQIKELK